MPAPVSPGPCFRPVLLRFPTSSHSSRNPLDPAVSSFRTTGSCVPHPVFCVLASAIGLMVMPKIMPPVLTVSNRADTEYGPRRANRNTSRSRGRLLSPLASAGQNHRRSPPALRTENQIRNHGRNHAAGRRDSRSALLPATPMLSPPASPGGHQPKNRRECPSASPRPSHPGNRSRNGSHGGSQSVACHRFRRHNRPKLLRFSELLQCRLTSR